MPVTVRLGPGPAASDGVRRWHGHGPGPSPSPSSRVNLSHAGLGVTAGAAAATVSWSPSRGRGRGSTRAGRARPGRRGSRHPARRRAANVEGYTVWARIRSARALPVARPAAAGRRCGPTRPGHPSRLRRHESRPWALRGFRVQVLPRPTECDGPCAALRRGAARFTESRSPSPGRDPARSEPASEPSEAP